MLQKLWQNVLDSLGILETNVWGTNGSVSITNGTAATNTAPTANPALGWGRVMPFLVPPDHVLMLTEFSLAHNGATTVSGPRMVIFADKVNGQTDYAVGNIFTKNSEHKHGVPLIFPAGYLVGLSIQNTSGVDFAVDYELSGYLMRVSGSGRPTIGDKGTGRFVGWKGDEEKAKE